MEQNRQNKQNEMEGILIRNKIYIAVIVVLLVVNVGLAYTLFNEKTKSPEKNLAQSENDLEDSTQEAPEEVIPEPENNLEENTHASIDRLVEKYCEYIAGGDVEALEGIVDVLSDEEKEKIQNRAAFIDSFENVTCYTKNGPIEDSYIVFVCYDMKLINIDTSAPDIICLYVGPKGDDGRRIHYGSIDASMQEYVAELEQDPEVQALYDDVSTRYQEAQEKDETLAAFIQKISGQVAEQPEETTPEEGSEETAEENSEETSEENSEETAEGGEGSEEETAEQPEETEGEGQATAQNRETHVTDSVNVRSEATTESERLALAYKGDPITQIESYDNGWSKVVYKGKTGYVKTEFLE